MNPRSETQGREEGRTFGAVQIRYSSANFAQSKSSYPTEDFLRGLHHEPTKVGFVFQNGVSTPCLNPATQPVDLVADHFVQPIAESAPPTRRGIERAEIILALYAR